MEKIIIIILKWDATSKTSILEWMKQWMYWKEWMSEWMECNNEMNESEWMNYLVEWKNEREWKNGMNGNVNAWMNEIMNEWINEKMEWIIGVNDWIMK